MLSVRFLTLAGVTVATTLALPGLPGRALANPRGPLVVLQVEAPDELGRFSPVDFGRSREVIANGVFNGLRVVADSGLSTNGLDAGTHARQVAEAFVGAGSFAGDRVSSLRVMTSSDFLNRILRPTARSGRAVLPPARLPGRAQVVNASFSGSSGWNSLDAELIRRADFVAARDGAVLVAGAVTASTGPFTGATLIWSARNVLAVRGDAAESVFDPAPSVPGRSFPDLWDEGTASVATARASSVSTMLIDQLRTAARPTLAKPAVVRAALVATADRTARPAGADRPWQGTHQTGVDPLWGAGKTSPTAASELLTREPAPSAPVRPGVRGAPPSFRSAKTPGGDVGFATLQVRPGATLATPFLLTEPASSVAAAVSWEVGAKGPVGNLRLQLHPLQLVGPGQYRLAGEPLAERGGLGGADAENLRLLVAQLPLEPGLYAWVVRNEGGIPLRPSLAWTAHDTAGTPPVDAAALLAAPSAYPAAAAHPGSSPVPGLAVIPEPAAALSLAGAAAVLLGRRRR